MAPDYYPDGSQYMFPTPILCCLDQYDVAHSLHLFFLVALLQYAVELCQLPVLPLFFLVPLLQYAVALCWLLVLPIFLLDPDVFSFYYQHPLCVAML